MRKISKDYMVTYSLFRNGTKIISKTKVACFRDLYNYSSDINIKDELHLEDFLVEETCEYSKIYLDIISKICNVNIIHVKENYIIISNIKNLFIAKVFTTLYRILFEIKTTYGEAVTIQDTANKLKFLEDLVNKKTFCRYRDPLKRFIHFHNINNVFMGPGHGIKRSGTSLNSLKTIRELSRYEATLQSKVQDFFTE